MRFSPRVLLLIILVASLLIRIQRLDYPLSNTFEWGDGTRDYLVANHILKYQEFPQVGPYNLLYEVGVHNSPIYFYLISLFLIPFNNILTLSLVNIFIQLGVIILIYLITKNAFNHTTAITAALLFSFNPEVIKQADFVWQPYIMLPFALLALYLKLKFHNLLGLATLCFASLLHSSAYPWIPLFFLFPKKSANYYIFGFSLIFVTLLLNGFLGVHWDLLMSHDSSLSYFSNLTLNTNEFLRAFYLNNILAVLLLIGFFITFKKTQNKKLLIFIFLLFILPIILASFFNKIRLHYIILSMVAFPILVAKVTEVFKPVVRIIIVIALLVVFSGGFSYFNEVKAPLENQRGISNLTSQVIDELTKIKQTEGFSDFDFFQVVSMIRTGSNTQKVIPYPVLDTFLLVGLEEKLNTKLATVSDVSPYNHVQNGKRDYLVLPCIKLRPDLCLMRFYEENPRHNIVKLIYEGGDFLIFLAKAQK